MSFELSKRLAAERSVDYIQSGMIVGLGTGSTVYYAINRLGKLVKQGLEIKAIATSLDSEKLAMGLGIPLISTSEIKTINLTIDGADEVDPNWSLIKGGGGALLREKIVAASSKDFIVIVDESKLVEKLGKFPLPVEVVRFGYEIVMRNLKEYGFNPKLREISGIPFVTDNGNYIIDCQIGFIDKPAELHSTINELVGVVDNGLFVDYATKIIVGHGDGTITELKK